MAHFCFHPLLQRHQPFGLGNLLGGNFLVQGNFLFQAGSFGLAAGNFCLQCLMESITAIVVPPNLFEAFPGTFFRLAGCRQFPAQALHFALRLLHRYSCLPDGLLCPSQTVLSGLHLCSARACGPEFTAPLPTAATDHPAIATNHHRRGPLPAQFLCLVPVFSNARSGEQMLQHRLPPPGAFNEMSGSFRPRLTAWSGRNFGNQETGRSVLS